MKRIASFLLMLLLLAAPAAAAEVESGEVYCFTAGDFSQEELEGICVTGVPDNGQVLLGERIIRPGDILTRQQVDAMTFSPAATEMDDEGTMTYLPIFSNRVAPSTTMTIAIRGKEDKSPVAEDFAIETYKNLPNQGTLKVSDPEGQALTFTLMRQPKRDASVLSGGRYTDFDLKKRSSQIIFIWEVPLNG